VVIIFLWIAVWVVVKNTHDMTFINPVVKQKAQFGYGLFKYSRITIKTL